MATVPYVVHSALLCWWVLSRPALFCMHPLSATSLLRCVPVLSAPGVNSELLTCGGSAIIFDYYQDLALNRKGRMDMLELKR